MEDAAGEKKSLHAIARDYFAYMGRHFPQQCASDEFYFFPRSETAIQHLDTLDDLTPEAIQAHVQHVRNLLGEISSKKAQDLEEEIDLALLKQSMGSFVLEFGEAQVWQSDPTLYVKIPLFATGRILSAEGRTPSQVKGDLLRLYTQIPPFLHQGMKNLSAPSEISVEVALNMARDALHFYDKSIPPFIVAKVGESGVTSVEDLHEGSAVSFIYTIICRGGRQAQGNP
jgi:hypothetical protein